jgi:hypothetical protein
MNFNLMILPTLLITPYAYIYMRNNFQPSFAIYRLPPFSAKNQKNDYF